MSIYNIGFYEDLTKIIFQLSFYTHLISSENYHMESDRECHNKIMQHSRQIFS